MTDVKIYTDGSCYPNPGPNGGWSSVILLPWNVVFVFGRAEPGVGMGAVPHNGGLRTTNNRMELLGILMGLRVLPNKTPVVVLSDSLYSINTITGTANSRANLDLISACRNEVARLGPVRFQHVRGHRGDPYNEMADQLAGDGLEALPKDQLWRGYCLHAIAYAEGQLGWLGRGKLVQAWYDDEVRLSLT